MPGYYQHSLDVCYSLLLQTEQRGLSVCVSHDREPCKTAEPIEMLFVMWICVGPGKYVLHGGPDPHARERFCGVLATH